MASSQPKRIQLRRTKGWRKPEGAIVVARPSRWGNPHLVTGPTVLDVPALGYRRELPGQTAQQAADKYRADLVAGRLRWNNVTITVEYVLGHLAGRDLACWCPLDQPCHADVLLEIANGGAP